MPKSKSSKAWLNRQADDPFVKQARADGWRARSVFKLMEIAEKYHLLSSKWMCVVDLGAAPGAWSQYVARYLDGKGAVFAVDLLPMDSLAGVQFIQGDFCDEMIFNQLMRSLDRKPVDLVISDMAPNMSGMKAIDQPRSLHLAELALDFAVNTLRPGGACLIKCFQGSGFETLARDFRAHFRQINHCKPKSSRQDSREMYLLGRGFKSCES